MGRRCSGEAILLRWLGERNRGWETHGMGAADVGGWGRWWEGGGYAMAGAAGGIGLYMNERSVPGRKRGNVFGTGAEWYWALAEMEI
jgi:hypothetical protein